MNKYWFAYHRPRDGNLGAAGLLVPLYRFLQRIPGSVTFHMPRVLWPISAEGRWIWTAAWAIRLGALTFVLMDGKGDKHTGIGALTVIIWVAVSWVTAWISRGRIDRTRFVEDYEAKEDEAERKREAEFVGKPNEPWMRWTDPRDKSHH